MNNTKHLIIFIFFLIPFSVNAQLNVKAGYNLGFVKAELHQQIYQQYNSDRPWLTSPLEDFNALNGLQLGFRYKFANLVGLELNWQNQYHRKSARGIDPATNRDFDQSVSFRYSSIGLGIENFIGPISLGASFNYDIINYKTSSTNIDKYSVLKDTGWSSHFFVSLNIEGSNSLNISLRPYAQLAWTKFNLKELNNTLNPSDAERDIEQDYTAFGIMLIFYNGGN